MKHHELSGWMKMVVDDDLRNGESWWISVDDDDDGDDGDDDDDDDNDEL